MLKTPLLWDPCLDIVGNRIPNAFVHPRASDARAQLERIRDLARALPDNTGIVIYPEGTRFTPEKYARALNRARKQGEEAYEIASRFRAVMPPIMGGTMALLQEATKADAVFCAHTGLESTLAINDLLSGKLVGSTLRVRFWRVSGENIPREAKELEAWFHAQWQLMDECLSQWAHDETQGPLD